MIAASTFVQLKCNHMKKYISTTTLILLTLVFINLIFSAYAQEGKGLKRSVMITNGDTIVNGKQISELDKDERNKLRKEFKEMENGFKGKRGEMIRRKKLDDSFAGEPNVLFWNDEFGDDLSFDVKKRMPDDFNVFHFKGDSSLMFSFNTDSMMKGFNFKMDGLDSNLKKRIITMHRDMLPGGPDRIKRREMPPMSFERRAFPSFAERNNSSSFNYNHVDENGIASRMNIRISDAGKEQLKSITGTESISKVLEVNDLTLFPNFSNGKMTLSFNLDSKGSTKVNILDSSMKSLFTDQPANLSGNYVKQISIPQNGVYYISISQNGTWFVKKLIKE